MARVAVLHHLEEPMLGHVASLRAELTEFDLRAGDPLPGVGDFDAIVSLGGEQTATDAELAAEVGFLRDACARDVPVLGICLGGQLLALALGARVWRPGRVSEWRTLRRTGAGRADPLFAAVDDPFPGLHWNQDVFSAPDGAEVLLTPDGGAEGVTAFRAGRSWAVQYHPDVDDAILAHWLSVWGHEVADPAAFAADGRRHAAAQARASEALFAAFAKLVA